MQDQPVRLLVVDDHEDVRFLIKVILQDVADRVEVVGEADGAETAVEQLDACNPDVVVLDARMPIHDGYDAAVMLLQRRPGLPIVLLTAHVDEVVHQRAEEAGIRAVLGKDQFESIPEVVLELAGRVAPEPEG